MLQDVVHPPEQLPTEDFCGPLAAQILDFCDDGDIFSEALLNSEVSSCSGVGGGSGSGGASVCCHDDVSLLSDFFPFSSTEPSTLSALLDSQRSEREPNTILDGYYMQPAAPSPWEAVLPPCLPNTLDHSGTATLSDGFSSYASDSMLPLPVAPPPAAATSSLPSAFDDGCMLSLSGYIGLDPSPQSASCSFFAPTVAGGAFYGGCNGVSAEGLGFYPGGSTATGTEPPVEAKEAAADYKAASCGGAAMGIYGADNLAGQPIYNGAGELQVFVDNRHPMASSGSPTSLASLEESPLKVAGLSAEERKEKIHRYRKKRKNRNFSKKIKYACRKTLADSRPRVRGRFAKNDDSGEATKSSSCTHEDEDEEEEPSYMQMAMKEEDGMLESSGFYPQLNAMGSFKCSYDCSWM